MLILFEGLPGSGKTTIATIIALMHNEEFEHVRANYEIKGLNNFILLEPHHFKDIKEEPTLAILDEGYVWLEARTSMNNLNKYLSYILFQSRKRMIHFLVTAQLTDTLDVRFRKMTDILIECERRNDYFHYQPYRIKRRNRRLIIRKKRPFRIHYQQASKIFSFFNSFEVIESDSIKDAMAQTMNRESIIELCNKLAIKMLKQKNKWSKPNVRAYLFEHNQSLKFSEHVYNAIKKIQDKEKEKQDKIEAVNKKEKAKKEREKKRQEKIEERKKEKERETFYV